MKIIKWIENNGRFLEIILTAITIWVAYFLLRETQKQVLDSEIALDSSASYNRRALEIADSTMRQAAISAESTNKDTRQGLQLTEKSIALAEQNSVAELRPYIYLTGVTIKDVTVGKIPTITWVINNFGRTPGVNVNIFGSCKTGTGIYEKDWNDLPNKDKFGYSIAPNFPVTYDVPFKIWTRQDSIALATVYSLYYQSLITYQDQFGNHYFTREGYVYKEGSSELVKLRKITKVK